jgi:HSP20 family molecular chaperone IbpA
MSLLVRRGFNPPASRDDLFGPFQQLWNEFYDDFFKKESVVKVNGNSFPKMDIGVDDGKFFIRAAVSGFSKDDIKVEMTPEKTVRISGDISEKYYTKEAKYWVRQLSQQQFVKEIQLPDNLNRGETSETIVNPKASLADGILLLTWDIIPTIEEKPKIRVVPINT